MCSCTSTFLSSGRILLRLLFEGKRLRLMPHPLLMEHWQLSDGALLHDTVPALLGPAQCETRKGFALPLRGGTNHWVVVKIFKDLEPEQRRPLRIFVHLYVDFPQPPLTSLKVLSSALKRVQ